jgi:hypothetical protein
MLKEVSVRGRTAPFVYSEHMKNPCKVGISYKYMNRHANAPEYPETNGPMTLNPANDTIETVTPACFCLQKRENVKFIHRF